MGEKEDKTTYRTGQRAIMTTLKLDTRKDRKAAWLTVSKQIEERYQIADRDAKTMAAYILDVLSDPSVVVVR